jgi:hypothetical protein
VTDGREPVGVIYEARGIYSAVTSSGHLVAARTTLREAIQSLMTMESSS